MGRMSRAVAALAAAALTIVAGAVALPAAATAPPPEQPPAATCDATPDVEVYRYRKVTPAVEGVREYLYERDTFKTKHEYRKQVRGVVEQRDNGKRTWHATGQGFDWTWWEPPSTKWSLTLVDVLESGPHSATVREWTTGNGHKHWRERSTEYRYVPTGTVEQIPTGTESSGWTTDTLTDPWQLVDERWATEPVDEVVEFYPVEGFTDEVLDAPWEVVETDTIPGDPSRWQDTDPGGDCYNGPQIKAPAFSDHSCTTIGEFTLPEVTNGLYRLHFAQNEGVWVGLPLAGTFEAVKGLGVFPHNEAGEPIYDTLTIALHSTLSWPNEPLEVWEFTFTEPELCEKPDTPEPLVVTQWGEWSRSGPTCDDPTVTVTRTGTRTVTTYKVIGEPGAWEVVVDEVTTEDITWSETRPLTDEEQAMLDRACVVLPPPPLPGPPVVEDDPVIDDTDSPDEADEPESDERETPDRGDELAETGTGLHAGLYALAASLLGGTLLVVRRRLS